MRSKTPDIYIAQGIQQMTTEARRSRKESSNETPSPAAGFVTQIVV